MSKKPPSSNQHETLDIDEDEITSSDKTRVNAGDDDEKETDTADKNTPDKRDFTEILATDPDPVQIGEAAAEGMIETRKSTPSESQSASKPESSPELESPQTGERPPAGGKSAAAPPKRGLPWFALFNFVLIVALAAAAFYYWREQQRIDAAYRGEISELQLLVKQVDAASKASRNELQSSLAPLKANIGTLGGKLDKLGLGQQDLRASSEKLYELFGRDKNDWQLAEVEYLMRVAQHKLILQDDFEGAAITLQAASNLIGETGDPGLLPVRVMISEEIADLKTRRRADLVGMTLMLAQLGRQVRSLQPGFALRVEEQPAAVVEPKTPQDWLGRFNALLHSLISIRKESTDPTEIEANIVDVSETLEDNLKLARWAVLERDPRQYQLLIDRSLQLFREFYDLDNAANHDFMAELQDLQKMVINPEKPDITGSLRELQRILSQRDNAPKPAATPATESGDG
jgi:uroporphyrin-3 C-methyltransferase